MKKIAVLSGKGGVGKSTICALLAVASGEATIIDCDPQSSLAWWSDLRVKPPHVISTQPSRIHKACEKIKSHYVFIDTPGAIIGGTLELLKAVDLVLIICPVEAFELAALNDTLNIVEMSRTPSVIIINRLHPRSNSSSALEILNEAGVEVCPHILRERMIHKRALWSGETSMEQEIDSPASKEVYLIWEWVKELING